MVGVETMKGRGQTVGHGSAGNTAFPAALNQHVYAISRNYKRTRACHDRRRVVVEAEARTSLRHPRLHVAVGRAWEELSEHHQGEKECL